MLVASSSTDFQVGRGVPDILPEEPSADVYAAILSNISALQQQLNNGAFAARAIYAWNSAYSYGANEITYFPDVGLFGALVKSKVVDNLNHPPYNEAGELKAEVKHYLKGELIKCYKIEPLILREVDCNLSGTPEIAALRQKTDALAKSLTEVETASEERSKEFNAKLAALLRFAYADYKDNIYLTGGSAEEFLKEFGFELSEEEHKEIFSKE